MVCLVTCACSLSVELVQWCFRLGLFEFDDVLDNTLGAVAGYAIYLLVQRMPWRRR
jgi:glycopeptide antibiotics resistance protein